MKRFLVFAGYEETNGGWGDFKGSFESEAEALDCGMKEFATEDCAWFEVVDLVSEKPIHCGGCFINGAVRHSPKEQAK